MGCAVAFHSGEGMVKGLGEKSLLHWYWETVGEKEPNVLHVTFLCAGVFWD